MNKEYKESMREMAEWFVGRTSAKLDEAREQYAKKRESMLRAFDRVNSRGHEFDDGAAKTLELRAGRYCRAIKALRFAQAEYNGTRETLLKDGWTEAELDEMEQKMREESK